MLPSHYLKSHHFLPSFLCLQMKKMLEFKGEPSELTEAEALMYGVRDTFSLSILSFFLSFFYKTDTSISFSLKFFKKVPRVREKISALLFVEEANEKLKECTAVRIQLFFLSSSYIQALILFFTTPLECSCSKVCIRGITQ